MSEAMLKGVGRALVVIGTVLLLQGCGNGGGGNPDTNTLLNEYFCGIYYPSDSASAGLPPCEEVRQAVTTNMASPLPTLSLGDPAKPALVFVHGWPDSAAEFAAQFGGLCFGPSAKYYCIAVTWQHFDPDVANEPVDGLKFKVTIDRLAATMTAANLVDTTLVIHDWGSFIGYQFMWLHPSLFNRVISFDIGVGGSPNVTYQEQNRIAWNTADSSFSKGSARYWHAPCEQCATWRSAWPYVFELSMRDLDVKQGPPSTSPLLFMYGNMTRGMPRQNDSLFFDAAWLDFVASTPNGKVVEVQGDHWFFHQDPAYVNGEILAWLASEEEGQLEAARGSEAMYT